MQPKVSIIWLNYNSARFLSLALRSLKSLFDLDYDNYEIIIVDNASTDGSFEAIKDFAERLKPSSVRVRFVRSDRNRGYSGGMNLGWLARILDLSMLHSSIMTWLSIPLHFVKLLSIWRVRLMLALQVA